MEKLFEALRESGFKQTSLSVQKDNPAVRFYQRLGYEMPEGHPGHAGQDDFLLVKELMKDGQTNAKTHFEHHIS